MRHSHTGPGAARPLDWLTTSLGGQHWPLVEAEVCGRQVADMSGQAGCSGTCSVATSVQQQHAHCVTRSLSILFGNWLPNSYQSTGVLLCEGAVRRSAGRKEESKPTVTGGVDRQDSSDWMKDDQLGWEPVSRTCH